MDDFKPPVRNDTPSSDPVGAGPVPYEDSETYVTPEGDPTPATAVTSSLAMPKKKSGAKKWLLGGFVVLLLAGLGVFAYWQYTDAQSAKQEVNSLNTSLKTLQSANRQDDDVAVDEKETQLTDEEQITEAATAYANAEVAAKNSKITIKILKQNTEFASVTASTEGTTTTSTGMTLKKVNDQWVIVYAGQSKPSQDIIDRYGIPAGY